MTRETKKETTNKERIVVLEKGTAMDVSTLGFCCSNAFMPIRAGW